MFSINACDTQTERNDLLAEIGDLTISVSEFELHYQYNPYLIKYKTPAVAIKEILAGLIAQKLLAQENKSPTPIVPDYIQQFRREALIEKFWEEKIASDISISDEDIHKLYVKSKTIKAIRYLVFENPESAQQASNIISNGRSFEQYAELIGLSVEDIPRDTIIAGNAPEILEDIAYSLDINETTNPIKIGRNYFIIKLQSELTNVFQSSENMQHQYARLEKILKQRRKKQSFINFIKANYPQPPYKLNRGLFKKLAQTIETQIDFSIPPVSTTAINNLSQYEIALDTLENTRVINFNDGLKWTAGFLIQRLRVSPYPINLQSPGSFRKSIIAATKNILDDEILVKESYKNDLENTLYVLDQTAMWTDHLFALNYLQSKNIDSEKQDSILVELLDKHSITIHFDKFQTLSNDRTNMVVFKTHFPVRTIVPNLILTENLPVYRQRLTKIFKN